MITTGCVYNCDKTVVISPEDDMITKRSNCE